MPLHIKYSGTRDSGRRHARGRRIGGTGLAQDAVGVVRDYAGRLKQAFSGRRSGAPPQVRDFLAKYGNEAIDDMQVCRAPIVSAVRIALDALSLGGFSRTARSLNYDNVFHLWIVIKLSGGSVWRFDKNEVVRVVRGAPPEGECKSVYVPRPLAAQEFFDKGAAQNPRFWLYDTLNNCQRFVMDLLRGSVLATPELERFVLQDAASLLTGMAKKAADAVTDVAGRLDILRYGVGVRSSRKPFRPRRPLPRYRR